MPNRLAAESSPYLRQHAENPVDWFPWGEEAFARARAENKPVLLSVGYSACHWCHVMAHESFEDPAIAALMNEHFVNVKVDREERPDVDAVYMEAVQALTGHGGWPMTVFLTPEGRPFFGGTYFPPRDRPGLPGFPRVLESLAEAYRTRRADVAEQAKDIAAELGRFSRVAAAPNALSQATLDHARLDLERRFDPQWGGFGGAPKFPPSMTLELLLRLWKRTGDEHARAIVEHTLVHMARGGLYDHLGGGFHRYSVDREWLVPHFEKMLYDNALLSRLYLLAHLATGDALYRVVACETLDYVARELTAPSGGFYATQDADSEGEEGKFFVWSLAEIEAILGPHARLFAAVFGVSAAGNFEGRNVLHLARSPKEVAEAEGVSLEAVQAAVAEGRAALFAAREARVRPGRDEKIVAAWNGMMLKSFAVAARALDRLDYRAIAERNGEFLLAHLVQDGRLHRIHKDGRTKIPGFLEDYANVIDGLFALYEATFAPRWLEAALTLTETMLAEFWDTNAFFDAGPQHDALFTRPRDAFDNATPAGNSVAIDVLLRLSRLADRADWRTIAELALASIGTQLERYPAGMGRALCALDTYLTPGQEVVLYGAPDAPEMAPLRAVLDEAYRPYVVAAGGDAAAMRALASRVHLFDYLAPLREAAAKNGATAYVCTRFACQAPVTDAAALRQVLEC